MPAAAADAGIAIDVAGQTTDPLLLLTNRAKESFHARPSGSEGISFATGESLRLSCG